MDAQSLTEPLLLKVSQIDLPGRLLFSGVTGSQSYNCSTESSDLDFGGVYVVPTSDILGIGDVQETKTGQQNNYTFHEVGKFCRLLLKGNPGIFEMVVGKRDCYLTDEWVELRNNKYRFLSIRMVGSYLGYLNAQLARLEKGMSLHTAGSSYCEKWAYHVIRLGMDAGRICKGVLPDVWKTGEDREMLLDIRNGKTSEARVFSMAKKMVDEVEYAKPWNLPKEGDWEWLNKWLITIRTSEVQDG